MTAAANQTAATDAAEVNALNRALGRDTQAEPAAPPAADPKPDYVTTPLREGYRRVWYDTPTTPLIEKPLTEKVFEYSRSEADRFDAFAVKLYAEAANVLTRLRRADGSFADPYATDTTIDAEAAANAQLEYDAIYCAISNLTHAATQLRHAAMALSPHIDPEAVKKLY